METNNTIVTAGNTGKKVRSDCFVKLEITHSGGIQIALKSKVKVLYGDADIALCKEILEFFGIQNARVEMEDSGALPFVIAARVEAAVKLAIKTEKEFLLPMFEWCQYSSSKERFRFSRLYLPGNTPNMMLNAGIHHPDGIILDLEDAVAPAKKDEARLLVRNALRTVNYYGAERMVRINQGERGLEDLKYIAPHNLHLILIPKCEDAAYIKKVEQEIEKLRVQHKFKNEIYFMPIIESAMGVEKAFEIATSSKHIVGMAIGLEDYTADLGVKRTQEGKESLYARTRLVNACKAAGVLPIDSVFSDVSDMDALAANVKMSKSLGFEGMGCIHPRQIKVIHDNFAPEKDELEKAKQIVNAFIDATEKGLGVVSIGSKMIDAPVVKRAEKIIKLAVDLKMLVANWREEYLAQLAAIPAGKESKSEE